MKIRWTRRSQNDRIKRPWVRRQAGFSSRRPSFHVGPYRPTLIKAGRARLLKKLFKPGPYRPTMTEFVSRSPITGRSVLAFRTKPLFERPGRRKRYFNPGMSQFHHGR